MAQLAHPHLLTPHVLVAGAVKKPDIAPQGCATGIACRAGAELGPGKFSAQRGRRKCSSPWAAALTPDP